MRGKFIKRMSGNGDVILINYWSLRDKIKNVNVLSLIAKVIIDLNSNQNIFYVNT